MNSWRAFITHARMNDEDETSGVLIQSPTKSEFNLKNVSCAELHDSEPALVAAGCGLDQDLLTIAKFNKQAEFTTIASLQQVDTIVDVSWRGDLLLAASYDGVVFVYVVPQVLLGNEKLSRGARAANDRILQTQTPQQVIHTNLHSFPVPPPTPGIFMKSSRVTTVELHTSRPERFLTLENTHLHIWDLTGESDGNVATAALPNPLSVGGECHFSSFSTVFDAVSSVVATALTASWSPHSADVVLCGGQSRALSLLDMRQRRPEAWRASPAHDGPVTTAKFSPLVPHWAASGGADGVVRLWDLRRNGTSPVVELGSHQSGVTSLQWSPIYAHMLVTGGRDRRHQLWSLAPSYSLPHATKAGRSVKAAPTTAFKGNLLKEMSGNSLTTSSSGSSLATPTVSARSSLASIDRNVSHASPLVELSRASLFAYDGFDDPLALVRFVPNQDWLSSAATLGLSSQGQAALLTFDDEAVYSLTASRFAPRPRRLARVDHAGIDADARDVERLIAQRRLAEAFVSALAVARRYSRAADQIARSKARLRTRRSDTLSLRSRALAMLELCYQCAMPESDPLRYRRVHDNKSLSFEEELAQYSYFIPPNLPNTDKPDSVTLAHVATLRLELELRIYAADNNAEAILERERDLHETLQRSGTNVARTAIAQALQCIKRNAGLPDAIGVCQRIEEPMRVSGQQRKVYAALVHGLLKPTIYDRVQVDESDPESENDAAASESETLDTNANSAQSRAKAKRRLDRFVRGLLTDTETAQQLKFIKRFEKRMASGDRNKALTYAVLHQPRVILSADINERYMDTAVDLSRWDVFFVHVLDLMRVVEGYPYHGYLLNKLKNSLEQFEHFVDCAIKDKHVNESCQWNGGALLTECMCQLICIIAGSPLLPRRLLESCVDGLKSSCDVFQAIKVEPVDVMAALQRERYGGMQMGEEEEEEDDDAEQSVDGGVRLTNRQKKDKVRQMQVEEAVTALKLLQKHASQ